MDRARFARLAGLVAALALLVPATALPQTPDMFKSVPG